jgi:hypothetical protein
MPLNVGGYVIRKEMGDYYSRIGVAGNYVTDGLLLYLDAAVTQSYPGSGTVWTDLTGNNNSGSLTNGPTYSSTNGGRIVLDGTNDYIQTNFSTDISSGFTVNCAFYNTYTPEDIRFLASMHVSSDANTVFRVELNQGSAGSMDFGHCYNETTIAAEDELISTSFENNTWHMVSLVWDGSTKYIYKNGVLNVSGSTGARPLQHYSGATLRIGARHDSNLRPMSGYISYFQVYNRVLSLLEIKQNFNATRRRFGL